MIGKTQIIRALLSLLIIIAANPLAVFGYWEDLDITSPSPEFVMLIYDDNYYHIFYFGGEEVADSVRMALVTRFGLLKDDIVVYEANSGCILTGLSGAVIGNGYLLAFFEIDTGKGTTNLNVLGLQTEKQPYGGTGPTADETINIKKSASKTIADLSHADLKGVDSDPIGETLVFGITERGTNDKKQKIGMNGVVSLAGSGGVRKLDVLSASFNVVFKSLKFTQIRTVNHSNEFSSLTNAYPTRHGGGGAVLDRAFWYFRLASGAQSSAPALPKNYRVEFFTNRKKTFPKQTNVEISEYEADSEFQYDFSGYDTNRSRAFYVDIRYRHEGGERYPNRLVGYERLDSGKRINPQNYGLSTPEPREKYKTKTYNWDYVVRDVVVTKKERFVMTAAVQRQRYRSTKNKDIIDEYIEASNWSLLQPNGPNRFHTEKVPLGREVFDVNLVRFRKNAFPIFGIYSYLDHNNSSPSAAGTQYGFALFYFKMD